VPRGGQYEFFADARCDLLFARWGGSEYAELCGWNVWWARVLDDTSNT
jgi:hypothetical protein